MSKTLILHPHQEADFQEIEAYLNQLPDPTTDPEIKITAEASEFSLTTNDPALTTILVKVLRDYLRDRLSIVIPPDAQLSLHEIAWLEHVPVSTVSEWVNSGELKVIPNPIFTRMVTGAAYAEYRQERKRKRLEVLEEFSRFQQEIGLIYEYQLQQ